MYIGLANSFNFGFRKTANENNGNKKCTRAGLRKYIYISSQMNG